MTAYAGEAIQTIPGGTELNRGSARFYRSSGSYFYIASAPNLAPVADLSIIASARFASVPTSDGQVWPILTRWGGAGPAKSWGLVVERISGANYLSLWWRTTSAEHKSSQAWSPGTGTWYRIAATLAINGANRDIDLLVDGTALGSTISVADVNNLQANTAQVRMGGIEDNGFSGENFDGNIDDVHFWGEALSSTSLEAWRATMAGGREGMAAYWPMEPPSDYGTDWSANEYDLGNYQVSPATHSPYASFSDVRITAEDWADWFTAEGSKFRAFAGDVVLIGASRDDVPPVISNLTPTPGQIPGDRETAVHTPIEFDVTDLGPGLKLVIITLRYYADDRVYVVHDGANFRYPFDSTESERTTITDGWHFKILPRTGWPNHLAELWCYAVDAHGNLENGFPVPS